MLSPGAVIRAARTRASALVIGLSLATVALTTGFISYTHISALTVYEHQSWKSAHLYPLAVDGQIAIGSVILMEVKGRHRWWGLLGFLPGLGESLVANWASGWQGHNLGAALWSTVPAQAFACSTFLFEMWLRHRRRAQQAQGADAVTDLPAEEIPARLAEETVPQAPEPAAPQAPEAVAAPALLRIGARPAGTPWGLVSPAEVPAAQQEALPPAQPVFAFAMTGAHVDLSERPKARRRARAAAAGDDRLPLPADEAELARVVASMSRNKLAETYQVSKYGADQLREQYLTTEKAAA